MQGATRRSVMFETVKAFHEALHTDSTWPFVTLIALAARGASLDSRRK